MSAFVDKLKNSHIVRAWKRYGEHNGDLLAAGVGYFAFFSIFPALALAFSVFGFVLQGRPDLLDTIANSLNETLPGMVKTPSNPEGIIGLSAPQSATLTITGIVSVVMLVFSGLGWIGALRTGIRGIFGLEAAPGNAIKAKLRDLGVLVLLGLGIALSAIMSSAVGGMASNIADWLNLPGGAVLVTILGLLVGLLFDVALMVVLLRVLSGVALPWKAVRGGAIFGAVVLTVLKFFGGKLIQMATGNPLLGAVAVAVGLLFWLNLMSRVTLLAAAWAANDADLSSVQDESAEATAETQVSPAGEDTDRAARAQDRAPNRAAEGGATVAVPSEVITIETPTRENDRASLAAGAVLGASGAALLALVRRVRNRR